MLTGGGKKKKKGAYGNVRKQEREEKARQAHERQAQQQQRKHKRRRTEITDGASLAEACAAYRERHSVERVPDAPAKATVVVGNEAALVSEIVTEAGGHAESRQLHALVLSGAALRCVDVYKALRGAAPATRPLKLFAKHIKPPEQVAQLRQAGPRAAGAGTPGRVRQLAQMGALDLESLQVLVLDCRKDSKDFQLCSHPDTAADTLHLVHECVNARVVVWLSGDDASFAAAAQLGNVDDANDDGAVVDASLLED